MVVSHVQRRRTSLMVAAKRTLNLGTWKLITLERAGVVECWGKKYIAIC